MDFTLAFNLVSGTAIPVMLYLTKTKLESIDRRLERLENVYFPTLVKTDGANVVRK